MSLLTEQDLLHPYLLRDSIIELLNSAAAVMRRMQEKARGDGYYKGYAAGVEFSKEKVEQMFKEWKCKMWSDGIDQRDLELAKESYEMQE